MEIPRHWRLKKQRYGLVGEVVDGIPVFPPRPVVPEHMKERNGKVIFSSSRLPLCTSDSCTVEQGTQQPQPVQ